MLQIFIRNTYLQNLKYSMKGACIFQLILVGILSILILSIKNRVFFGLTDKIRSYLSTVPYIPNNKKCEI